MSTTDTRRIAWWAGILCALAASLAVAGLLAGAGERDTAAGVLTGGLFVVLLMLVGRWRSARDVTSAATASRVAAGAPDERDAQVLQRAFAVVGLAALLASALGVVTMYLGVDAEVLVAAMPWVHVLVGVVAFVVVDRRT
jgi:hypothetical protein